MNRLHLASLLTLSLIACGGGSSTPDAPGGAIDAPAGGPDAPSTTPDASTDPFACLGQPLPTQAPPNVTVSGKSESVNFTTVANLAGTVITAYNASGTQVGNTTSATDGTYAITLATGGTPLDGYIQGTHANDGNAYVDTFLYPPSPLVYDTDKGRMLILTQTTYNVLPGLVQAAQDTDHGILALIVADCNGNPIKGAMVTTEPAGSKVVYNNASGSPTAGTTMTEADGIAYIFNAGPDTVNVRATYNSMTLRAHNVNARKAVLTTTVIQP